jgi:signal transduction histidine kinase
MHLGAERQHRGYAIDKLALDVGSISDSVGELGKRHGLSFSAREYQVFNQCIDNAVSSAVDRFWSEAMEQYEHDSAKRIGFLAHELRNALAGAKASFWILKRGELGLDSKTGETLARSLGRLENLINQTLLTVRLQAGVTAEPRRMQLARLLREVEETAVRERNVRLKVEVDDALELDADERLLVSAASNLLQNAFKFTHEGGEVILRGRREGDFVLIEVEDECGGLPPGRAEELFQPYVQRAENRRGMGLGLAITREAVEAHHGELLVRNLPGKGCVFALKLRAPRAS